jgi:hypothetical protein
VLGAVVGAIEAARQAAADMPLVEA